MISSAQITAKSCLQAQTPTATIRTVDCSLWERAECQQPPQSCHNDDHWVAHHKLRCCLQVNRECNSPITPLSLMYHLIIKQRATTHQLVFTLSLTTNPSRVALLRKRSYGGTFWRSESKLVWIWVNVYVGVMCSRHISIQRQSIQPPDVSIRIADYSRTNVSQPLCSRHVATTVLTFCLWSCREIQSGCRCRTLNMQCLCWRKQQKSSTSM